MIDNKQPMKNYLLLLLAAVFAIFVVILATKIFFSGNQSFDYISVSNEKLEDNGISRSIALGLKQRRIYIDNCHASIPLNPYLFDALKISYEIGQGRLTNEQSRLYNCGILLMNYAIGKPEFSDAEYKIVKKFMVNGGGVMLLCPVWVWESYDKKSTNLSPYYKIARYYGLEMSSLYVESPLKANPFFVNDEEQAFIGNAKGVFSSIICQGNAIPILFGKDKKIAAALAYRDNSKIFIWSHNNLFNNDIASSSSGTKFLGKIFDEMFNSNSNLLGKYVPKIKMTGQNAINRNSVKNSENGAKLLWIFINRSVCFLSILSIFVFSAYWGLAGLGKVKYENKYSGGLAAFLLAMAITYYVNNLSAISILIHLNYGTGTHDVGVYDQVIWLASRFMEPFSTLGRMNIFGVHASFYCILLAPLFWIWSSTNILYIAQSIFIALASVPIFLYSQKKLGNAFFSLMIALSFLLYPAMQNMNLDNFHPEAITIFFISWTIYFLLRGNYKVYYPLLFLSIIAKEEVALTAIFIGIYLWLKKERKHAIATIIIGITWLLFCLRILMPWANGALFNPSAQPLVYSHWFSAFSQNIFNPSYYYSNFTNWNSIRYIINLLYPLLFIPLLSPVTLIMLAPSLAANLLSGCGYFTSSFFHYDYIITGVLYFSAIEAVYSIINSKYGKYFRKYVLLVIGISMLLIGLGQPPAMYRVPLKEYYSSINRGFDEVDGMRHRAKREYLKRIPVDAKISVSYSIWPQLDHRKDIYHFPNPFREAYWTDYIPRPYALEAVEYVVIDWNNHLTADEDKLIIRYLMDSQYYEKMLWSSSLMILQRTKTESNAGNGANYALFSVDKAAFLQDDFLSKLPLIKTGKIHNVYFPESNFELRNLLGELIANKKKLALLVTGYVFFPESGECNISLQSDSPAMMEIDGKPVSGAISITKGFHAYRVKYINIDSRFNLKIVVLAPSGQKYIISDQYLFYEKNEKCFADFMDEFNRKQAKKRALGSVSKNLIANSDFEIEVDNKPQGWNLDCWQSPDTNGAFVVNKEIKKSGKYSCMLQHRGKADSRWTQIIDVRPNTRYKLSGWIKTIDVARLGEGVFIAAEDTSIRSNVIFGSNDWVYVEAEGVTNVDQKTVKIECRLGNWGSPNSGTAYFDNIEFKEVFPGAE